MERNASPFESRFNIPIKRNVARKRFRARVFNTIYEYFPALNITPLEYRFQDIARHVANRLGQHFDRELPDPGNEFAELLKFLEALYDAFSLYAYPQQEQIEEAVNLALWWSEIDLGIQWKKGIFIPSGAKLLDEQLVNESLLWLADNRYENVRIPFQNGLKTFLEINKDSSRLDAVVLNMYKAMEALAKIVTGRSSKDLSANTELLINKLKLNRFYANTLNNYIKYANEYCRHGGGESKPEVVLNPNEVETFIYITGIFIRLASKQI